MLVDTFLCCAKYVYFDLVPFVYFCFCFTCLRRHIKKKITKIQDKENIAMVLIRSFMLSGLKFLLHFEFTFVHGEREQFSLII